MRALFDSSHHEARRLVSSGAPVFLGINPIEYHGPHLSLKNDALLSRGTAGELHRALCDMGTEGPFLWAGELDVGVDPVPGPGSQPVSPTRVRERVTAACRSLVALGATRVVLVTLHGAPLHNFAIHRVVQRLQAEGVRAYAPAGAIFEFFLAPEPEVLDPVYEPVPEAMRRELRGRFLQDFHAGFLETSLALHYAPESVHDHTSVPPCPTSAPDPRLTHLARMARRLGRKRLAAELSFAAEAAGWARLDSCPGYTSVPHLATVTSGRRLAEAVLPRIARIAHRVLSGETPCPAPVLCWLAPLTLNGRLMPAAPLVSP